MASLSKRLQTLSMALDWSAGLSVRRFFQLLVAWAFGEEWARAHRQTRADSCRNGRGRSQRKPLPTMTTAPLPPYNVAVRDRLGRASRSGTAEHCRELRPGWGSSSTVGGRM